MSWCYEAIVGAGRHNVGAMLSSRSHIRLLGHRLGDSLVHGDDHVLAGHDCGRVLADHGGGQVLAFTTVGACLLVLVPCCVVKN